MYYHFQLMMSRADIQSTQVAPEKDTLNILEIDTDID